MSAVRSVPYISALKRRSFTAPVVMQKKPGAGVMWVGIEVVDTAGVKPIGMTDQAVDFIAF